MEPLVVRDPAGDRLVFEPHVVEWLLSQGHVHGEPPELATLRAVGDLVALCENEPALRECDFCRAPTTHRVNVRPFVVRTGPRPGPRGPDLPMLTCETCATLIEANKKLGLIDHAQERLIVYVLALTPELANIAQHVLEAEMFSPLRGDLRYLTMCLFAERNGRPERLDDVDA